MESEQIDAFNMDRISINEEGEILSEDDDIINNNLNKKPSKLIINSNMDLEEGELSEDKDSGIKIISKYSINNVKSNDQFAPTSKIPCRFFTRGINCHWGMNCRFLHHGVNDALLNFSNPLIGSGIQMPTPSLNLPMIDQVEEFGIEEKYHEQSILISPTGPESSWERGLKQAKKLLKRNNSTNSNLDGAAGDNEDKLENALKISDSTDDETGIDDHNKEGGTKKLNGDIDDIEDLVDDNKSETCDKSPKISIHKDNLSVTVLVVDDDTHNNNNSNTNKKVPLKPIKTNKEEVRDRPDNKARSTMSQDSSGSPDEFGDKKLAYPGYGRYLRPGVLGYHPGIPLTHPAHMFPPPYGRYPPPPTMIRGGPPHLYPLPPHGGPRPMMPLPPPYPPGLPPPPYYHEYRLPPPPTGYYPIPGYRQPDYRYWAHYEQDYESPHGSSGPEDKRDSTGGDLRETITLKKNQKGDRAKSIDKEDKDDNNLKDKQPSPPPTTRDERYCRDPRELEKERAQRYAYDREEYDRYGYNNYRPQQYDYYPVPLRSNRDISPPRVSRYFDHPYPQDSSYYRDSEIRSRNRPCETDRHYLDTGNRRSIPYDRQRSCSPYSDSNNLAKRRRLAEDDWHDPWFRRRCANYDRIPSPATSKERFENRSHIFDDTNMEFDHMKDNDDHSSISSLSSLTGPAIGGAGGPGNKSKHSSTSSSSEDEGQRSSSDSSVLLEKSNTAKSPQFSNNDNSNLKNISGDAKESMRSSSTSTSSSSNSSRSTKSKTAKDANVGERAKQNDEATGSFSTSSSSSLSSSSSSSTSSDASSKSSCSQKNYKRAQKKFGNDPLHISQGSQPIEHQSKRHPSGSFSSISSFEHAKTGKAPLKKAKKEEAGSSSGSESEEDHPPLKLTIKRKDNISVVVNKTGPPPENLPNAINNKTEQEISSPATTTSSSLTNVKPLNSPPLPPDTVQLSVALSPVVEESIITQNRTSDTTTISKTNPVLKNNKFKKPKQLNASLPKNSISKPSSNKTNLTAIAKTMTPKLKSSLNNLPSNKSKAPNVSNNFKKLIIKKSVETSCELEETLTFASAAPPRILTNKDLKNKRREELLRQLKAVEEAIARKRK